MGKSDKKYLKSVIESLVIAIGREKNTQEFYGYLAKTIRHQKTKEFFQNIVCKESGDIKQTEAFLKELEEDLKKIK